MRLSYRTFLPLCLAAPTSVVQVLAFGPPMIVSPARFKADKVGLSRAMAKTDSTESVPLRAEKLTSSSEDVLCSQPMSWVASAAPIVLAAWTATAQTASAAGPDWGIFEGRIGSLLHPITMGSLFVYSLYTGYLGLQWRRQRTMGDEIAALKRRLPQTPGTSTSDDGSLGVAAALSDVRQMSTLEAQIAALTEERKKIAAAGPRDQHFSQGALLACIGTLFAIEGPLNTYARAGKLFPGPHLYVGAGLVCLWAIAVACVPAMQKGNDTARTIHIASNVLGTGLFGWQVVSGIPILLKVIEKTNWP